MNDKNPHELIAINNGCCCEKCPIANESKPQDYGVISTFTRGSQYPVDGIIIVGEIPTFNDKRGPLSGRAKRNWKEALDKSGLSSLNLLLVPAVHCVPGGVLKKSDRHKIVHACRPSLNATISAQHDSIPILLMGTDAIQAYGLDLKIQENRGFLHGTDRQRKFIITYAATSVMFGQIYWWGTFIEDLRKFYRLITNTLKPGLTESMVKTHANKEDITQFVFECIQSNLNPWFAVDIETTAPADNPEWGKDPTRAFLKTIAFGTPERAISLHWESSSYETKHEVLYALKHEALAKVFHNGPWFDLRVQERYGLTVNNWEDTRDLRRAISSTSRLSLGYLGSLYCDIPAWKLDDGKDKLAFTTDLDKLLLYNGYDTIVTARIYAEMKKHLHIPATPENPHPYWKEGTSE